MGELRLASEQVATTGPARSLGMPEMSSTDRLQLRARYATVQTNIL